MHRFDLIVAVAAVGAASVGASVASNQGWYDNACNTSCDQYMAGSAYTTGYWNYDYTQGQNGVACGSSGTCSTTNKCGPYCWDEIAQSGTTNYCGGDVQTPIDITFASATEDNSIEFPTLMSTGVHDGCDDFNFFADDHAWEVSVTDADCKDIHADYDGEEYIFHQLHFHFPSEHTFNGFHDAEVHFVHKNADATKFFVLGVFLDVADVVTNHPFLKPFMDMYLDQGATFDNTTGLPDLADTAWSDEYEIENFKDQHTGYKLNPYRDFLPNNPAFFHYTGSLTTYPCTEGVEWFIYDEPLKIGAWDLGMFKAALSSYTNTILETSGDLMDLNDNRPVQPLGDRILYYSTGIAGDNAHDDSKNMTTVLGVSVAAIVIGCLGFALASIASGYTFAKMSAREKTNMDNKGSVNA